MSGERHHAPPMRDDGLPTLPTGEPVLPRWFVLGMLVLAPAAVAVTVWAFLSVPDSELAPAERRPPGTAEVSYERGEAQVLDDGGTEPGPDCAQRLQLVGAEPLRATGRTAVGALCEVLADAELSQARAGLNEWAGGRLQFAAFELSGVESSTRAGEAVANGPVVELNAKFADRDPLRAVPVLVHELTVLGDEAFPGRPVDAGTVLEATEAQHHACEALGLLDGDQPPRGCRDAADLLEQPDPREELVAAGFRDGG